MKGIKTNIGTMSKEDYLDIVAMQHGFSSYKEMKKEGYVIDITEPADSNDLKKQEESMYIPLEKRILGVTKGICKFNNAKECDGLCNNQDLA